MFATFVVTAMINLWPSVVKGVCLGLGNFARPGGNFLGVAKHLPCPFIPCPSSRYPPFHFAVSVSTVPLNSGIKLLTCSNGEQCCPLAACAGSTCICTWCNLIIFVNCYWNLILVLVSSKFPDCKPIFSYMHKFINTMSISLLSLQHINIL